MGKIMSFLGVAALCGLLGAGLVFPLAATGGAAASAGSDILEEIPAELSEEPMSTPSRIYANDGETVIATFFAENREPVSYDEISQDMKDAIIAIEDERFYDHGGVDAQGVARAAVITLTSSRQQGASTLTMQYVNNVLNNASVVRGDGPILGAFAQEKTYADKLREMKLAVAIEQEMTKEEIIEGYLNIIQLGGRNYGVEAAAQYYWGVPASELDIQQSAVLAGMVQAPNTYHPIENPDLAMERRNVVLGTMLRQGFITEEEYEEAVNSDLGVIPAEERPSLDSGCMSTSWANYFCDYVEQEILTDETFGETREDRERLLHRGGLNIVTTLDAELQEQAEATAMEHRPDGTGAVAVINSQEPGTGNVLAMAQSTRYDPSEEAEDGGATSMNFNAGQSHSGGIGFPGGSVIKPFVAAAWIEEGGDMDDRVEAWRDEYEYYEEWDASCMDGGSVTLLPEDDQEHWEINNVIDDTEREMSIDFGLYYSINTATVATAYDMDLCAITDVTNRLGIEGFNALDDYGGLRPDTPSFIMGTATVTPMVMNRAYAAFANDGEVCEERVLESVTDAQGTEYEVPGINCEQAIDPDIVAQVNDTMINIAETNAYVEQLDDDPPFPMAGKTGTHESVSAMSFQGFTEGISTGAYIARPGDDTSLWANGNVPTDQYASSVAFPFWYDYMREVAGNYDTGDFPEADDSPFDNRRDTSRYAFSNMGGTGGGSSDSDDNGDDDDDD
ncbi:transglycosylase domain-containing protein [Nesterenkonia sedimenti]|uniref:transglycosylase domain-containing protein n=1 Tax=Nesterenkonia sedimenti TaxID=1463632 RepID=UPI002D21AE7A|nr:transglycosylase domain-containing protein [Nesterenkonia sedimenti]